MAPTVFLMNIIHEFKKHSLDFKNIFNTANLEKRKRGKVIISEIAVYEAFEVFLSLSPFLYRFSTHVAQKKFSWVVCFSLIS
jgi:hypothetical protein